MPGYPPHISASTAPTPNTNDRARDTRQYRADVAPPIAAYFPVEQYRIGSRLVVVRTHTALRDVSQLTNAVLGDVHALDQELPAYDVSTMAQRLTDSFARRHLSMLLLTTFGVAALILAAVGVYGPIAYWVGQRRRDRTSILALIAHEFGVTVGVGVGIGLVGAFALTRLMSGLIGAARTASAAHETRTLAEPKVGPDPDAASEID